MGHSEYAVLPQTLRMREIKVQGRVLVSTLRDARGTSAQGAGPVVTFANQNAAKRLDFESSQRGEFEDARFPQCYSTIHHQVSP